MGLVNSSFFFLHNLNMSHENQEAPQKWLNRRLGRSFVLWAPYSMPRPKGRIRCYAMGPVAESYPMPRAPWQNHIPWRGPHGRIIFHALDPQSESVSLLRALWHNQIPCPGLMAESYSMPWPNSRIRDSVLRFHDRIRLSALRPMAESFLHCSEPMEESDSLLRAPWQN
jgi:hypothetical protein